MEQNSQIKDAPAGKRRFNEISVLFPLLSLYTLGYLGVMVYAFLKRGGFAVPSEMMAVYIALLGAYAADKEIRRWIGVTEPPRKGTFFVYLWMLFFLVAWLIHTFTPEFKLPDDLLKVVLQVLGIFFGSRASKYVNSLRSASERSDAVQAREQQVLALIKAKGRVQNSDVATALGVSDSSVRRLLAEMMAKGLIRRMGERKGAHYEAVTDI